MPEIPENIVIPPPAIKEIIHKTAGYVDRNGRDFENKIRENEASNKQFAFLNDSDSYHQYYIYVLENFEQFDLKVENDEGETDANEEDVEGLVEPEPLDFIMDLPPVTLKDLEIIKLTALFVAQNGDNYANSIRNKYTDDAAQFSFLNDGHSLNQFYIRYLKQYTDLLNGKKPALLQDKDVIESSVIRAKFNIKNKSTQKKQQRLERIKKELIAAIDWQDSVIVKTIDFTELDDISELPPPLTIADLQFRSLEAKSKEVTAIAAPVSKNGNPTMKIKEFGATRLQRGRTKSSVKEKMIECPITGKMIPESGFEKHIQILLRDPKYKEEKANYESKIKNSNLSTDQVVENIKSLFKPSSPNQKRQKVQWDGYKSSINFVKDTNTATKQELEEFKRKKQQRNEYGPQLPNK